MNLDFTYIFKVFPTIFSALSLTLRLATVSYTHLHHRILISSHFCNVHLPGIRQINVFRLLAKPTILRESDIHTNTPLPNTGIVSG